MLTPLLSFLDATGSPFVVNLYPWMAWVTMQVHTDHHSSTAPTTRTGTREHTSTAPTAMQVTETTNQHSNHQQARAAAAFILMLTCMSCHVTVGCSGHHPVGLRAR